MNEVYGPGLRDKLPRTIFYAIEFKKLWAKPSNINAAE
jgi:hypothetical protein